MPRKTATILAAAFGAVLAVLYVIRPGEASPAIPKALASLTIDKAPKPAPAAAFVDAEGRPVTLATFKGRVVILNMWATWCAPCVVELPAVAKLATALDPGKVSVVAVNLSKLDAAGTADFLKAHGAANLSPYRDPDLSLLSAFGARGLPFSVIIDGKGRVIAHASGPMQWDDPAAVAYFKGLASRAPS